MDEQSKIRGAMAKLTDVLAGIARTADEKNRERCPFKTVELRCTYAGGCQNQLWDRPPSAGPARMRCGGDNLNFEPISPEPCALRPEPL